MYQASFSYTFDKNLAKNHTLVLVSSATCGVSQSLGLVIDDVSQFSSQGFNARQILHGLSFAQQEGKRKGLRTWCVLITDEDLGRLQPPRAALGWIEAKRPPPRLPRPDQVQVASSASP